MLNDIRPVTFHPSDTRRRSPEVLAAVIGRCVCGARVILWITIDSLAHVNMHALKLIPIHTCDPGKGRAGIPHLLVRTHTDSDASIMSASPFLPPSFPLSLPPPRTSLSSPPTLPSSPQEGQLHNQKDIRALPLPTGN